MGGSSRAYQGCSCTTHPFDEAMPQTDSFRLVESLSNEILADSWVPSNALDWLQQRKLGDTEVENFGPGSYSSGCALIEHADCTRADKVWLG